MKQLIATEVETKDRTDTLRNALEKEGACDVGFADISNLGLPLTREYPFAICFTIRRDDAVVDELPNDEMWRQVNASLTEKTRYLYQVMKGILESWEYRYSQIPSTTRKDELPDPGEMLPQKTVATLSGLGWIGRSTLLISPRFGPRIRIGALLTTMPLKVNTPVVQSHCKDCNACVDACPVNAIKGNVWSQATPRSEIIHISLCYEYMWRDKATLGRRQDCGICLKVCPAGQER